MRLLDLITAKASKPVKTAVSKIRASVAGSMFSEQATSKYNEFFDSMMSVDTDEVLEAVGLKRHQLETLLYDDEIDEKVERRIENLTQATYTLSPSEGEVAKFVYEQLDEHLEHILIASMNAKLYGYSVTEITWTSTVADQLDKVLIDLGNGKHEYRYYLGNRQVSEKQRLAMCQQGIKYPETCIEKPIEWFEPKSHGGLLWYPDDYSQPQYVDTKCKFLLQQHRATYANPKGKALLSRVYWLWFFKKNGWTFWSKFLERSGSPLLAGTTEGDPEIMASALAQAHSQAIFTMPTGDKVQAISSGNDGESFSKYNQELNRRISKYILGQTLTSGIDKGGTYGQGKVHQEQQEIIFDSDKRFATRYIQKFIDLICEINGYQAPEFEFRVEKGIQCELAERDQTLVNQGLSFTLDYYSDMYDIDKKYIKTVEPTKIPVNLDKPSALSMLMNNANDKQSKFTPEQQELENLVDYATDSDIQPINGQAVLSLIKESKDVDELTEKLFDMVGNNLSESEFTELMAVVNQVADIHGMVDETLGN